MIHYKFFVYGMLCLILLTGCSRGPGVPRQTRGLLWERTETYRSKDGTTTVVREGPDKQSVARVIAGIVSIIVPSPLPIVAAILSEGIQEGLVSIGNSIRAVADTPRTLITGERAEETTPTRQIKSVEGLR